MTHGALKRKVAVGDSSIQYWLRVSSTGFPALGTLVAVHGISRNSSEIIETLSAVADELCLNIVAPRFGKSHYGGYQRIVCDSGARADEALLAVLDDADRLMLSATPRVALFGFSGGAQFAHRFALVHPECVQSLFVASAGYYTFPRTDRRFPYGLRSAGEPALNLPGFLQIPLTVAVGGADTERDVAFRQDRLLDVDQGRNRIERAKRFTLAVNLAARALGFPAPARFRALPGAAHDYAECAQGGLAKLVREHLLRVESGDRGRGRGAGRIQPVAP